MQPYIDTKSGEVDTWPAHASGHAIPSATLMLSKNKSLILYDEESTGKPNMIPKPRFLDQLESYLRKELRALGVTEVCANDLRLQVSRDVRQAMEQACTKVQTVNGELNHTENGALQGFFSPFWEHGPWRANWEICLILLIIGNFYQIILCSNLYKISMRK